MFDFEIIDRMTSLLNCQDYQLEHLAIEKISHLIISPELTRDLIKKGFLLVDRPHKKLLMEREIGCTLKLCGYLVHTSFLVSRQCPDLSGLSIVLF